MKKTVFVDIDGVVCDSSERFKRAEIARSLYLVGTDRPDKLQREADSHYWQTAFDPELVCMDTLIPGVNDALNALIDQDYQLIFLTSRPQSMQEATLEWFSLNIFVKSECQIIFKAPAFQYTKTTVWKAGMVQTLASLYDAQEIVFVDDEENNCQALREATDTQELLKLWCYHSLQEAVTEIAKG